MMSILREYRCESCGKLLCKGLLKDKRSALEVKCKGCGAVCTFHGGDAEIIKRRSVLIRQGLIPDTDKARVNFSRFTKLAAVLIFLLPFYSLAEDMLAAWPS